MNDSAFGGRCNNFIFKISVTQPWTKPRRLKQERKKEKEREKKRKKISIKKKIDHERGSD